MATIKSNEPRYRGKFRIDEETYSVEIFSRQDLNKIKLGKGKVVGERSDLYHISSVKVRGPSGERYVLNNLFIEGSTIESGRGKTPEEDCALVHLGSAPLTLEQAYNVAKEAFEKRLFVLREIKTRPSSAQAEFGKKIAVKGLVQALNNQKEILEKS